MTRRRKGRREERREGEREKEGKKKKLLSSRIGKATVLNENLRSLWSGGKDVFFFILVCFKTYVKVF